MSTPQNPTWPPADLATKLWQEGQPQTFDYNRLEWFRRLGIEPPTGVYVTRDDQLLLTIRLHSPFPSGLLSLRTLTPDGQIVPQLFTVTAGLAYNSTATLVIPGVEGFLLSASFAPTGGFWGDCYATLQIQRGQGTQDVTRGALIVAGYCTALCPLAWPNGPLESTLSGPGEWFDYVTPNPAAGADVTFASDGLMYHDCISASIMFTASAAVANREVSLEAFDGGGTSMWLAPAPAAITAGQAVRLTWTPAANPTQLGLVMLAGMPELRQGYVGMALRTKTVGLDVADQISNVVLVVRSWLQ
jgi:hypothetical protein